MVWGKMDTTNTAQIPSSSTDNLRTTSTSEFEDLDLDDWHVGQHPALQNVCVVDCGTVTRIIPNAEPVRIDNECFEGYVMLMIRTPDVDDPKKAANLAEIPQRISHYMKGKLRRFEFQFRVKLKKVPTGPLFLGCELEHPIKVGRITKSLASVLLAMIRRINSGFHYSWGTDVHAKGFDPIAYKEGRYEKTHLSFPVEASMDRIVITKPGETPPPMGVELQESEASVKRRRRMGAGSVDWNLEDTYTMCLWSAYCDWIKWKTLNVPGVRPFSLSVVTGKQPIYLSVYELQDISPSEYKKKKPPHNRSSLAVYSRMEFSNRHKTEGGMVERLGSKSNHSGDDNLSIETDSEIGSDADLFDTTVLAPALLEDGAEFPTPRSSEHGDDDDNDDDIGNDDGKDDKNNNRKAEAEKGSNL